MAVAPRAITRELAQWAVRLRSDSMPSDVHDRVKDVILDAFASALAGQDASESSLLIAMARSIAPGGDSTVIGGEATSEAGATLANGYLITAVTVCDIHRPTSCHVTPEVIAPALVVAETSGSAGDDFIAAVAAGLEVTTRVGLGLGPKAFRSRGWHAPGVTGPFGGAAAVGRLIGLDATRQAWAFGIAGSQSAGTYAQLGTPTIKFQQSRGALSGLMSARLASQGFSAAEEILTHPDGGLLSAYSDGSVPDAILDGLGERWELMEISLRAWPVAAHLQPVVTGLMHLGIGIDPERVRDIEIGISETAFRMHGTVDWSDRFRARLSAPYVAGVTIVDGACWLDQFTPDRVRDPGINAFIRDHVTVHSERGRPDYTSSVAITYDDGTIRREDVRVPKGDPLDPLSHEEVVSKFRTAAAPVLPEASADRVIRLVSHLEEVATMREITRELRVPGIASAESARAAGRGASEVGTGR